MDGSCAFRAFSHCLWDWVRQGYLDEETILDLTVDTGIDLEVLCIINDRFLSEEHEDLLSTYLRSKLVDLIVSYQDEWIGGTTLKSQIQQESGFTLERYIERMRENAFAGEIDLKVLSAHFKLNLRIFANGFQQEYVHHDNDTFVNLLYKHGHYEVLF